MKIKVIHILQLFHRKFQPLIWLSANYLLLVAVLLLCRVYFLAVNRKYMAEDFSWLTYLQSFQVGLRFDLSVAAYLHFALLLAILFVWLSAIHKKWQQYQFKILGLVNGFFALFYILFLVVDAQFYHEFNQHLSFKETDYLTSPELAGTIIADYPLLLPAIVVIILFSFYIYFSRRFLARAAKLDLKKCPLAFLPVNFILITGLLIIAARGGVGLSTLNWGAAIFTDDQFANQLALNGLFSFGKSYDMEKDDDGQQILQRMGISYTEAVQIMRREIDSSAVYLNSASQAKNSNPLARLTKTGQPLNHKNVVVILLESWMAEYIGALGSKSGITPNFDRLADEGVLFTNFYAGGSRSNRGIVSVVTGYPSHYGSSVMKQIGGQKQFYSLPGILKERGYQTDFIYGGDPEFDNMQGFLMNNGVTNVTGQNDFPAAAKAGKWGVSDETMFNRAIEILSSRKEPFFGLIFTLSNHEPFDAPPGFSRFTASDSAEFKYMNTYAYSDYALGRFFDQMKSKPFYSNTIFVLVADHGKNRGKSWEIDPHRYHIPLLILNSGLPAQKITATGSQNDLLPTLMQLLGGDYTQAGWGRNLWQSNSEQAIYISPGDIFGLLKKDTLLTVDLNLNSHTYQFTDSDKHSLRSLPDSSFSQRYSQTAKAYFALSYIMLKNRNYGK